MRRAMVGGKPVSMVDLVYDAVRERIVSGQYAPDSKLSASAIAAENDVSVIPVREALRRLEAERLVAVKLNFGATVAPISSTDLLDLYRTRIVIECYALREAAPHHTDETLAAVAASLPELLQLIHAGSARSAADSHKAFHYGLYRPAHRPWTLHVIDQLWNGAERYVRMTPNLRDSPEDYIAEHAAIVDALRAGEVNSAVEHLRTHLWRSCTLLSAVLIERDQAAGVTGLRAVPTEAPMVG